KRGVSPEAALGGAASMYPEYRYGAVGPVYDRPGRSQTAPTGEIEILPVQGNVSVIAGPGGDVVVQACEDGVLLVDTGEAQLTEKTLAAIRQISNKPIRFILNTNARADHIGGNEFFAKNGSKVGGGLLVGGYAGDGAAVIAHEQVLKVTRTVTDA